ncbi:hypothetical protein BKA82DRAFT_36846 [Pisolithus tinctorius]|uniref:Uncharacterized protein n=1 Tax=Pisolithus tinctorius Marx 270 TaxID=870435 RepID=A0A0C3N9M5_PISTI|nr:hypothetical protein BKA82DRAFT_36846 [Pisolithus tinctorius]KIN92675.1 hypothetical protein M404DRAFT_36846 [Pisolithus tinctorius Marx 270]
MLFLFACGSVVRHEASLTNIQDTIVHLGFSSAVAFDAEFLQPVLTSNLVNGIVERVYIEGYPIQMVLPEALADCTRLGGHSGVFLFTVETGATQRILTTIKYIWGHRDIRPWGQPLPIQCPRCAVILVEWKRVAVPHGQGGSQQFICMNGACGELTGEGPVSIHIAKLDNLKILKPGKCEGSAWLEIALGSRIFDSA